MQSVHWTDPDWETTWGLGFSVYKGTDGNTWVGHGGSCPGYRSTLQLDLKNKRAFSVMINASGTNPAKYSNGINGIISKVKPKQGNSLKEKDLQQYTGHYSQMPWWGEVFISTWDGKLVALDLPSEKPENDIVFYKHIEDDVFRRVRDDDNLGETLIFERDNNGRIIHFKRHGNYSKKIAKLTK
jgi:hypothetical protein